MSAGANARNERLDVVAAVLLALATVATAWSCYRASRWNGEQAKAASRSNAARIESAKAASLAQTQTQIDVELFTEWVDAFARGEERLTDYAARLRAPLLAFGVVVFVGTVAWLATFPVSISV